MSAFAARYARALADVVFESHLNVDAVLGQLADFAGAWHESADLREVFLDPSFPTGEKVAILDKINVRVQMGREVRNFIAVLISHDRLQAFDEVLTEFRYELNRRLGIAEVEVTTARGLNDEERRTLESKISALLKSQISAVFHQDPSLVGGVIVQVGSTVYDGSVRGRLDRLREQLAAS